MGGRLVSRKEPNRLGMQLEWPSVSLGFLASTVLFFCGFLVHFLHIALSFPTAPYFKEHLTT